MPVLNPSRKDLPILPVPKDAKFLHLDISCSGLLINKAPISGSTRWLNDTPLIQLTGRYNRNDSFWFTLFHEAGHILLHGKKDIFLENLDYADKDIQKEQEADTFAVRWTLAEHEEAEILAVAPLSAEAIKAFARQFNTHPAIIIGRLQHKKHIRFDEGKQFLVPVEFDK